MEVEMGTYLAYSGHYEKRPYTEAELKFLFWQHDKNRDCRLSRKELRGAFKELGAIFPVFRAYRALRHADDNGDGYISEDEMEKLVNYAGRLNYRHLPVLTRETLGAIFQRFQTDGSLGKKQLKAAFTFLGSLVPSYRASKALNYADRNKDGYITEGEMGELLDFTIKLRFLWTKELRDRLL